ncbi:ankyrin [Lophiostoma macrostomum CBS 122681]|uniref:Ankyrin n=1 Tax=Lophiostoma macrostomum CBS 122681 TaxID=1314788 RepID=A0A6A6TE39_9PLEO|nr:ankyrin [Lophiostoma macrostomum CBS 122681]
MLIDLRRGAVALTPLMLAAGYVLHGDDDRAVQSNMFTLLLSNGADISLEDEAGRTCLHMVARSDAENIALQLLAAGAEVNGRDHRQATPLHYAAQTGHTAMVRTLLEAGAEAVARDAFGVAVIHSAAISCNIEVIRLLIERAVDVHVVDSLGRNSLYYFTAGSTRTDTGLEDLKQIFRWLYPVADLSEINAEHDRDESEFPSWSNNIQVPKTYTPLSKALKDGNWKMFWLLRDAGAEISEPSDEFVRQAVIDIQPTALQYSLEKGITPEMKASFSQRCPDFYISKKIDPDDLDAMLPSLIALGFDINAMGYGNLKLVDAASTTDSAQLARVLLKHGANPYEGHRQLDPFLVAATRQNWDFLHGLLLHAPRPAPEGHWLHHLDNIAGEDHDDPERLCISLQASGFIAAKTNLVFSEAVLMDTDGRRFITPCCIK